MRVLLLILLLAGCATQYVPVSAELDCPDPLVLEKASPELKAQINEMKKNNRPLYDYFYYRDLDQETRRQTLQDICRSTYEN